MRLPQETCGLNCIYKMNLPRACLVVSLLAVSVCFRPVLRAGPDAGPPAWFKETAPKIEAGLGANLGEPQRARLRRGLAQTGEFWRAGDGDAAEFTAFVRRQFAADPAALDAMFDRFDHMLAHFDGHFSELRYELKKPVDLDTGPVRPFDELFAAYEPNAYLVDDCFRNKLAFVVLLNFPLTTLDQRLAKGETWSRRQWAEARLAQAFSRRIPGEVNQAIAEAQAEAELYIDDSAGLNMFELRAKARRLQSKHALSLIIVDYLQLMTSGASVENRVQEVSAISRNLKVLARDLEVPIVALSQLSRAVEQRSDKRPILSDLRESGAIEQDADIVGFIYRDEYYNDESDQQGLAEIIVAKHRNGPTDTVKLSFLKRYAKFADLAAV